MKLSARVPRKCRCRPARRHRDCAYCGCGGDGLRICGACAADGIDGPVIAGTARVRCATHRAAAPAGVTS